MEYKLYIEILEELKQKILKDYKTSITIANFIKEIDEIDKRERKLIEEDLLKDIKELREQKQAYLKNNEYFDALVNEYLK